MLRRFFVIQVTWLQREQIGDDRVDLLVVQWGRPGPHTEFWGARAYRYPHALASDAKDPEVVTYSYDERFPLVTLNDIS